MGHWEKKLFIMRNSKTVQNLVFLLERAIHVSAAVFDNCWEDCEALSHDEAARLKRQLAAIARNIDRASTYVESEAYPTPATIKQCTLVKPQQQELSSM
jgi:hypothetical protein